MEETNGIIRRPLYIDRIKPFVGKSLIKVLSGQRRVGKSYILKGLMEEISEMESDANFINVNLEDYAFSQIRDAQSLNDEIISKLSPNRKNYIFIDEIQEVDGFEKVLRSLILDPKNDIYVTGSNSKLLSSEISSMLSGRSIEFRIHPLTYKEFLNFHSLEDSFDTLNQYLYFGGMPYLVNLPLQSTWMEYLQGITDSIVYRDIIQRHSLRNNDFLQRLFLFLSDNIGQIFTAKRISDYLKSQRINMGVSTIQTYVEFLEEAFLINRINRWNIEGKKFFEIGEKIFFEDLGIRNSIIGFRPQDISGIMENVVFNYLAAQGYRIKIGVLSNGREIDFVAEKNGENKYFQIAVSVDRQSTFEREFGNLLDIPDNYEKILVTLKDSTPNSYKGIRMIDLRELLSNETF